jgi:hypothetical protein
MKNKIIVSGGYPFEANLKRKKIGFRYKEAFLAEFELPDGKLVRQKKYVSAPDRIGKNFNMQFKFGQHSDNKLILPTGTEIVILNRDSWDVMQTISHPTFNDLHCVKVYRRKLYIVNTGLEIVQIFDLNGNCHEEINVTNQNTWKRFNLNFDYRFVATTKPHLTHVNYIFFLDGEPWVTRFQQGDAVALNNFNRRINLSIKDSMGKPHDGLIKGDYIYFTLTDGFVVIVNRISLIIEKVINLNKLLNNDIQLGWCRGIEVANGKLYVGFSQLRYSKFVNYGHWIKHRKHKLPAWICVIDLKDGSIINQIPISSNKAAAIFTILAT